MALLFHHRTTTKSKTFTFSITNPSLLRRFFSDDGGGGDKPPTNSSSPFSSYFRDVKESLKQQKPSNPSTFTASSNEEIKRNLSEFRRRTEAPPPGDPSSSPQISFQDIYKRNVFQKPDEPKGDSDLRTVKPGGKLNLNAIRESLQKMRAEPGTGDGGRMSLPAFKDVLKSTPSDSGSSKVIGGTRPLPESVFGRELRRDGASAAGMRTEFVKMYGVEELGEKLKKLRPEGKEFSIAELNERLIRLREMEEKEPLSVTKGLSFTDLRASLVTLKDTEDDKAKKNSLQRIEILGQLGGTPNYLLGPPKEHLVEKYFHPDNMSSAEKLKIELTKVRDEFKMSESDCGSARVQVATLTTKIKHLSSVLHKKDVHSRKGLLAMVQRRKRLLKYLRRTDWDSYCFVISKLGLRDNPEHTYKTRTRGRSRQAVSA